MNRFSEKDWKLFRSKLPGWQEAYMEKLNQEYIELLSGEGNASSKFWALEKRIREDQKDCGVQCHMSRSNQFSIMVSLLNEIGERGVLCVTSGFFNFLFVPLWKQFPLLIVRFQIGGFPCPY